MHGTTRIKAIWILVLVAVAALCLIFGVAKARADSVSPAPAASPTPTLPASGDKTVLRVGSDSPVDSLNPFIGQALPAYDVYHLSYDLLVRYDPATLAPTPGLATSWSYSNGGRTWTFDLRHGVKWQDGQAFTARDVVFTSAKPKATMLQMWVPIVPEHIWSKISPKDVTTKFENNPPVIGTGLFQVIDCKSGEYVQMKANPAPQ